MNSETGLPVPGQQGTPPGTNLLADPEAIAAAAEAPVTHPHLEDYAVRIKPKSASNLLLWAIVSFFVLFVLWANLTELDRTVRGQGKVIPSSQLQVVSNLEGGIVAQIFVRTGQIVKAGAELVRLDETQSGGELGSSRAAFEALDAKIARLSAEIEGRSPSYPVPSDEAAAEQIRIERALHASRSADLASMLAAGNARLAQAERGIAEAQAAHDSRVSARDAAKAEADMIRPLVRSGIEPRLSLVQAENAERMAVSDAIAASAAISRAMAGAAEARATLAQMRQDWRATAATELATSQAELAARRSAMPALADKLRRTIVRAPLDGRVNRVMVTTVGGSVRAGDPLVEIVPSEESLLVEAQVDPKDIASVRLGQTAKVDIGAYDSAVYGSLHGKVVAISPDAIMDERTERSHYIVRVRTDSNALVGKRGEPLPIGPGMTTSVSLLGDKRSVMAYILSPLSKLKETAFRE